MQPNTDDLPFVVVYGPWIWKLGLVALVAVVLCIAMLLRRFGARNELHTRLRLFAGDGTIRGKLGGSGDGPLIATLFATQSWEDDERAHWRAADVWIETDEGRVRLAGKLAVELGTGGTARRRKLPDMPEGLRAGANELPRVQNKTFKIARTSTLRAGDEVIARGTLERAPGGDGTGFRDAANTWTLHAGNDDRIRVAATQPRIVLARMSVVMILFVAGMTTFLADRVGRSLGNDPHYECWDRERYAKTEGFVTLDNHDACLQRAALPGHYDHTLAMLYDALEKHPHRDERSLARLLALAEETGGCEAVISLLQDWNRHDDVIVHARRCNQPRAERDALAAIGRLEEAVRIVVPDAKDEPETGMLITTNRWSDAVVRADARAHEYATMPREPDSDGSLDLAAYYYGCVTELFRHYAGDPGAFARLQALEAAEQGQVCLPVLVEASPPAARAALIARFTEDRKHTSQTRHTLTVQAFLEGTAYPYEYDSAERTMAKLDDGIGITGVRHAWLAKHANIDALSPLHRALALRWRAIAHVLDGKPDDARRDAAEAVRLAGELGTGIDARFAYALEDVALLPAAIALHTNAVVDVDLDAAGLAGLDEDRRASRRELRNFRFGRLALRAGRPVDDTSFGPKSYLAALHAAQAGDGLALARHITQDRWWHEGDVLAVLPHVKTNRDVLIARLPHAQAYETWRLPDRAPFELASAVAVRRDMYRVAGDTANAAYWEAVYRRIAATFDRKRVMAHVLWAD